MLDEMQTRLDENPDAMRIRRTSAEHPYGTIEAWVGATHFLTRGLERVKTQISLHKVAYNFRRLLALLGLARYVVSLCRLNSSGHRRQDRRQFLPHPATLILFMQS